MSRSSRASRCAPALAQIALALVVLAAERAAANPVLLRPQYRVRASIGPGTPQIEGTVEIAFTNHSTATLDTVVLWLFANRFSQPDPWMNDFYRPYVYPEKDFDPGGMQLGAIEDGVTPTFAAPLAVPDLPLGTAMRVPIAPLNPGETRRLTVPFLTDVPYRFGSFGEYASQLTLVGGWYPYLAALDAEGHWVLDLPPALGDYDVTLTPAPGLEMIVNGRYVPAGTASVHIAVPAVHYLSLLAAPRLLREETTAGDTRVVVLRRPPALGHQLSLAPDRTATLLETLRRILELRPVGVPAPPPELVIVEAPLRLDLTAAGEGDVIISDRILALAAVLRPLHQVQLAQAIYAELLRPSLARRESAADYVWVSEGLSHELADRYIARAAPHRRGVYEWIDLFDILAVVDRFERTPNIPFVSAFFPRGKEADPRRDQIMTFNQARPPGRVVLTKVHEQVGTAAFDVMLERCVSAQRPFRDCAAETPWAEVLPARLDDWTAPYPAVDYRVDAVRFNVPEGDGFRSSATIRRVSSRPFPEPVTVRLRTIAGADADLQWKSDGEVAVVSAPSASRVYQVIIDPERMLIDDDRANNAWPPRVQVVLDSADVEVSSTEFGVAALLAGRLRYDYRKDLAVAGFYTNRAIGFAVGPRLHWGTPIDAAQYRHNLYAFYTFAALDSSFENKSDPAVRTRGHLGGFGARYDYTNVYWPYDPTNQRRIRLYADWYDRALGSDFGYVDWGYVASATTPLWTHRTTAAAQIFNGFSQPLGGRVPNQGLYSLGGSRSIRGIGVEEELARNLFVIRTEIRRDLFPELDMNLLDALVLRRLQPKILLDAGNVSNAAGRIYDVGRWACGVGVGVTAMYEFLGFFPASAYLDIATRVDEPSKAGDVQVLFGSTQEF